jgi:hypothetical protein
VSAALGPHARDPVFSMENPENVLRANSGVEPFPPGGLLLSKYVGTAGYLLGVARRDRLAGHSDRLPDSNDWVVDRHVTTATGCGYQPLLVANIS